MNRPQKSSPGRIGTDFYLTIGLVSVVLFFIATGIVTYLNTRTLLRGAQQVTHTHEILTALADTTSIMKDAETGQRGFVITGDERYLEPYTLSVGRIEERFRQLEQFTSDSPDQQARIPIIREQVSLKLHELDETIQLRRTKGFEEAKAIVITDRGKATMDSFREQVDKMEEMTRQIRREKIVEMTAAYNVAVISGIIACLLGIVLSLAVGYLLRRTFLSQRRQDWLQTGQVGLASAMIGDKRVEQLSENTLKFLAEYLKAHVGAMFIKEEGFFKRVATYGVPTNANIPQRFTLEDGLLGQAVKDKRTFIISNTPENYLTFGTSLGQAKPHHLLIAPFSSDGLPNAVLELGFGQPIDESIQELFDQSAEPVGMAVRAANYRARLQDLLEEAQRQAEELQAQGEELRVSNEELEEQSRALRESQARLEQQQAELEQTNTRLEEQSQLIESQRNAAYQAREAVQIKARELEQASRYKSDFLANMSHELRTPLNSSLILAKLLADNPQGNLSKDQVRYAETIQAAGNDLLTLINDILDLSKIEAGHMEVQIDEVRIADLINDLVRYLQPVAEQKQLTFQTNIASDCPKSLQTDRQRLEQVLKNLLSNAIKFTEKGSVQLSVEMSAGGRIAFAVRDTGVGIPDQQQEIVFEAFRQADGTTNRKYGGTGLGLSISRELTRLLGGELSLSSKVNQGSTFTVTLPMAYEASQVKPRTEKPILEPVTKPQTLLSSEPSRIILPSISPGFAHLHQRLEDDREQLTGSSRLILVVEDDAPFARIVFDLAHEHRFQCLIANTAEEGLALAIQHRPSAVILDVGLPDNSGLSVLDRLKRDSRTRHIPVHVVSAHDYTQTALSLGAIAYMLKPVKREELEDALAKLETRLEQRLRRVLIVEDDAVQRDSMQKLLATHDVETIGAASAAECLELLRTTTFDCMVLDLSLPDASGYSLLETLSREDAYAFPPVIVYTGRELASDEEQRLRKYSKSIIIKGAKSPERLLDEVTLFLHQVVSELPPEQQLMLEKARSRDAALEGRRILVAEDDVRNVFALTSILEARGATLQIARNGREAIEYLEKSQADPSQKIDLVLMDIMMPEMDGITAMREIRKREEWKRLPIIALTAKAMKNDQEQCLSAGANDYMAKPLDVEKLLSLVRVWMPR